jgi:two-component system nitrogen regulation sensor histidine kinase GlnL
LTLWRDIVDSLGDAVIAVSPELVPEAVNPAAETLMGASQISRATVADLVRQNEWLGRMLRSCLKNEQNLGDAQAELVLGPRQITVRAEVSPLFNPEGKVSGAVILLHDLSHEKGAEQVTPPNEASLRLSPAGLAHEVKNPLTGIKGAAELLAAMFPAEERAQQYCGLILDGVNRIAALVEQVLAVSSPQRLAQEPVNIHQVLHQALKLAGLHPGAPDGVVVEQDFDPSLPEVTGDAAALERAFLNLVRNAAEAMGGAGRLRLHTRIEAEFRMTAEGRRRQFLRVEVSDSGPGMSDADMAQLFTPFFTTKPTGTGLGLVLSQRIIALHGGRLWAERGGIGNKSGAGGEPRGMTFKVTLPVRMNERAGA